MYVSSIKLILSRTSLILLLICAVCCDSRPAANEVGSGHYVDSIIQLVDISLGQDLPAESKDSVLAQIFDRAASSNADSIKKAYYSRLSYHLYGGEDSSLFRRANRELRALAIKTDDSVALAESYWDMAEFYNSLAVIDSAFYYFQQAREQYELLDDDFNTARMWYNMGVTQSEVKDYTGSEINTIRAVELFKPLKKNLQLYLCYTNLGSITKELEEYDQALEYYEDARAYLSRVETEHNFGSSLNNNIGVVYQEMGKHGRALDYFSKVVEDSSLIRKNPKLYARALNNLAYSKHKLDSTADLTDNFRLAVRMLDSIGDWQGIARAHYNGAEYFKDRKDTAHALAHANLAMEYALRSKNNKRLLETMELMVSLDPDNAIAHTQAYIKLDDSLQREERAIRNKFARIRFETDEFIAQNELLARQRQLWIGVAAGVFLLAFSVFIIIMQRIKNQRLRFQQQQQESNQEIFNLMLAQNQKLEEGKQSEQKRISEELHDGILGEMNGVRMVLLGLNKKMDDAAIALRGQAITKLQEIQEEIRTISHELSDASYRKFHNFVISLQELIKTMGEAAGMRHEMTYDEDIDWDALQGDVKINLYRIVQECLQNSVKHSQASIIKLNLHGNSKNIVVTIHDNGKGFRSQNGKKGIGQKNISSRVKKLKGSWNISSSPGQGTEVVIKIPYSEAGDDIPRSTPRKNKLQEA